MVRFLKSRALAIIMVPIIWKRDLNHRFWQNGGHLSGFQMVRMVRLTMWPLFDHVKFRLVRISDPHCSLTNHKNNIYFQHVLFPEFPGSNTGTNKIAKLSKEHSFALPISNLNLKHFPRPTPLLSYSDLGKSLNCPPAAALAKETVFNFVKEYCFGLETLAEGTLLTFL